jgi:hypothetical protein
VSFWHSQNSFLLRPDLRARPPVFVAQPVGRSLMILTRRLRVLSRTAAAALLGAAVGGRLSHCIAKHGTADRQRRSKGIGAS